MAARIKESSKKIPDKTAGVCRESAKNGEFLGPRGEFKNAVQHVNAEAFIVSRYLPDVKFAF